MVTTTLFGKATKKRETFSDYDLNLEYYIVAEPLCADYSDLLRYGVKINMTLTYSDGRVTEESKEIRDIFYRKKDAEEFTEILVKNKVTPTHFREVVEDYITSKLKVSI